MDLKPQVCDEQIFPKSGKEWKPGYGGQNLEFNVDFRRFSLPKGILDALENNEGIRSESLNFGCTNITKVWDRDGVWFSKKHFDSFINTCFREDGIYFKVFSALVVESYW